MNSTSLICIAEGAQNTPVYVVPAAGSTPFSVASLAQKIGESRPFYTFEFAGLMNRQPKDLGINEMVYRYVEEIKSVQNTGPYQLGGHCLGGIIALEIAARLESIGDVVSHLTLLESLPPQANMILGSAECTDSSTRQWPLNAPTKDALELTFKQMQIQLASLPEKLAERFGVFGREQIEMIAKQKVAPILAPISLLHTKSNSPVVFDTWQLLSHTSFTKQLVPGDAYSMLMPPNLGEVARVFESVLGSN